MTYANPNRYNRPHGHEAGFVLVSVLWILAILTVLSLGFGRRAMMERKVAWYALDHAQALQMARGAAERGIVEIANGHLINLKEDKIGYTGLDQRWAKPVNILREANYYEASNDSDLEGEQCRYRIVDTNARISINSAPEEVLREIDGLSATAVRHIMARRRGERDSQELPRFLSIDEIRHLPGVDDRDWYGREPGEGLRDILTVWGGARVNLNTAPPAVLDSLPEIRDNIIGGIIGYRAGSDGELFTDDDKSFGNINDVGEKLSISADKLSALRRYCSTNSNSFRIEALATRRGGKIVARVTAVVREASGRRQVLQWNEDVYRS